MNNPEERDLFLVARLAVLPDVAVRIDCGEANFSRKYDPVVPSWPDVPIDRQVPLVGNVKARG